MDFNKKLNKKERILLLVSILVIVGLIQVPFLNLKPSSAYKEQAPYINTDLFDSSFRSHSKEIKVNEYNPFPLKLMIDERDNKVVFLNTSYDILLDFSIYKNNNEKITRSSNTVENSNTSNSYGVSNASNSSNSSNTLTKNINIPNKESLVFEYNYPIIKGDKSVGIDYKNVFDGNIDHDYVINYISGNKLYKDVCINNQLYRQVDELELYNKEIDLKYLIPKIDIVEKNSKSYLNFKVKNKTEYDLVKYSFIYIEDGQVKEVGFNDVLKVNETKEKIEIESNIKDLNKLDKRYIIAKVEIDGNIKTYYFNFETLQTYKLP